MKKRLLILLICLSVVVLITVAVLLAVFVKTPVEKNRLQFIMKEDGTYAVSGIPCKKDFFSNDIYENGEKIFNFVRIPAKYNGIPVTEIYNEAFYCWKFMKGIYIPPTVTRIGDGAFLGCSQLQSVSIPKSVAEIGEEAFCHCPALEEVKVLNPSISIDETAFKKSSNISTFKIKKGGNYYFSNGALIESSTKTLLYLKDGRDIPDDGSVEKLGDCLFYDRQSLKAIIIPESVSAIGDYAFAQCHNLRIVVFSGDIYELGSWCFYRCYKLEKINIEDLKVKEIQLNTFVDCSALKRVNLPEEIEKIGESAFCATSIQTITLPASVTEIDGYAFALCKQLKTVQLNDGISRIEDGAFSRCEKLTSISIPDSITYFGKDVFKETPVNYYVDDDIKYLGNEKNNCLILVDASDMGLTEYKINSGTRIICDQAFIGCTELKEVEIPESVVYIGPDAFENNVKIIRKTGA